LIQETIDSIYDFPFLTLLIMKISDVIFLNQYERLQLLASLYYMDKLNCSQKFEDMILKSNMEKEVAKNFMKKNGCFGSTLDKKILTIKDFEFYTCPCNFLDMNIGGFLEAYSSYKNGIMPFNGGSLEQPSKWYEIKDVLQDFFQQKEIEENKKQKKTK